MASDDSSANRTVTITTQGATKTLECLEPWRDDGNIILTVQEKCFRVHRTTLASYSEVFKDMFAIPHSDDVEEDMIDGCPVVHLHDAVDDVQLMLKALYDRSFIFFSSTPMPVSVLTAFLRMGKKYAVHQLFQEAKKRLSLDSPPLLYASKLSATANATLFPRVSGSDPFNFMIMNIANEVGLLSTAVMALFYCCLACPPSAIANGYEFEERTVMLSAPNVQCCILGLRYLAEVDRRMVRALGQRSKACEERKCRNCCANTILSNLRLFQDLKRPFMLWDPIWDDGLCTGCRAELRKRHEEVRNKLWKRLPSALGLGPWEELDDDALILEP